MTVTSVFMGSQESCSQCAVGSSCNLSLSLHEMARAKSLWFTGDHLVSGAHKEIRDEGKERGIEAVDRREVRQEGKRHACQKRGGKKRKPFNNSRHFSVTSAKNHFVTHGRNKDRSLTQPWGTWTVPALTPLTTSCSKFSFTLYLGSQHRTGRCLNNNLLSLTTEHLTGANKGGKSSRCHLYSPCLTLVALGHLSCLITTHLSVSLW